FFRSPGNPGLLQALRVSAVEADRWNLETLSLYTGAIYSIPLIFHEDFDRLALKEMVQLGDTVRNISWENKVPGLSVASVNLIASGRPIENKDLKPLAQINHNQLFIYRNQSCLPRATFISHAVSLESNDEIMKRLTDPSFDPQSAVLIQGAAPS